MKNYFLTFLLVFLFSVTYSQITVYPETKVETGYLYGLNYQLSQMEKYDGAENSDYVTLSNWNQIYSELAKSNLTQRKFESISVIHKQAVKMIREENIPIGLILFNYNYFDDNPETLMDEQGRLNLTDVNVKERNVFAATAFRQRTLNGNNLVFSLPKSFIFTNHSNFPDRIFIDFDDDSGWQQVTPEKDAKVKYTSTGKKTIAVKAILNNGEVFYSKFNIDVVRLETPAPSATWLVEADLSYNDVSTTGDAYILLSNQNTELTKPVVICEGIDFDNSYTWETLYELFNQHNMLEDLRAEGFDIVILNFHNPLTYIQSNAYLFEKLVQMVNDTINFETQISIVGPSMGGLVTRYALTHMENTNIDHNSNLWISFDTPHQGANIPLGLQYSVLFFKDLDANVQMMLDVLYEPAAKQMLVYYFTNPPTTPASHNAFFDVFQNELSTMGDYPENLRKIAISNGRGDAIGQPYTAGDQAIEFEYYSFFVDITGNIWTVKNNASGQIFEGLIDYLFVEPDELNVNVFSPKPYDNAPGGMRSTFADLGEVELPFGEINVLLNNHAYIPTISGLDINDQDLFYNLSTNPNIMELTPFDSIYWSPENYDHSYISPETAQLIINEILTSQLKTHEILLVSGWNDLSSYIDPTDKNIQSIANQLGDNLIIMQYFDEVFWPDGGINSLNEWNYKKGYQVKVDGNNSIHIIGSSPNDKSIAIIEGWNLIPVLCKDCNSIIEILGDDISKVKIIREGVGLGILWPEKEINTLENFVQGNSYFLLANESFILTFE